MRRPVVVIGGGTSGCTVAALLAATTTREIVLIESGNVSMNDDEPRFMDVVSEQNTPPFAMVSLVEGELQFLMHKPMCWEVEVQSTE